MLGKYFAVAVSLPELKPTSPLRQIALEIVFDCRMANDAAMMSSMIRAGGDSSFASGFQDFIR
jgi:hypothetical protein